jgi:hypothetical protein
MMGLDFFFYLLVAHVNIGNSTYYKFFMYINTRHWMKKYNEELCE